jgi:hypothetical protein
VTGCGNVVHIEPSYVRQLSPNSYLTFQACVLQSNCQLICMAVGDEARARPHCACGTESHGTRHNFKPHTVVARHHTAAAKRSVDYVTDCAISRVCKICTLIQAAFDYLHQGKCVHRLVPTIYGTVISGA